MWLRRIGRLMAVFGAYSLGLAAIGARYNGHGTDAYRTGLIELAVVTMLFVVAVGWVLTRKPRIRPTLEELDE